MKKCVSFLLVVCVLLSLGVSAMAAGSPVPKPPRTGGRGSGLRIYNSEDKLIAVVPWSKVTQLSVGQADQLSAEEKDAFLAAYEEVKNMEGKIVRRFFWLDVPQSYKDLEDFAYARWDFGTRGQNVQLSMNGKDMEVIRLGHGQYWAKVTEFGALAIISD